MCVRSESAADSWWLAEPDSFHTASLLPVRTPLRPSHFPGVENLNEHVAVEVFRRSGVQSKFFPFGEHLFVRLSAQAYNKTCVRAPRPHDRSDFEVLADAIVALVAEREGRADATLCADYGVWPLAC